MLFLGLGQIDWPFLVISIVALVVFISWPLFKSQARKVDLANLHGDSAAALEAALRYRRSWVPAAILNRLLRPGAAEALIAGFHHELGNLAEAVSWATRGLTIARAPELRWRLHFMAAAAAAESGDATGFEQHLAKLKTGKRVKAPPAHSYHELAIAGALLLGQVDRAMLLLQKAIAAHPQGPGPLLLTGASATLAAAGKLDALVKLVDSLLSRLLASGEFLRPPDRKANEPTSANLRLVASRAQNFASILNVMITAERSDRWDLYERCLPLMEPAAWVNPRQKAMVLARRAVWAAHCGNPDEATAVLQSIEALVIRYPADRRIKLHAAGAAAAVRQLLGQHDLALAALKAAEELSQSTIGRATWTYQMARSLAALGRTTEAGVMRAEAARLAPGAYWCEDLAEPAVEQTPEDIIGPWVHLTEAAVAEAPAAQVASGSACAAWILAVFAIVPLIGSLAAIALGTISIILLGRRQPLAHDRRAGVAGLSLAVLSLLFTATCVLNIGIQARHKLGPLHAAGMSRASETTTVDSADEEDDAEEEDEDAAGTTSQGDESGDEIATSTAADEEEIVPPPTAGPESFALRITWDQTAIIFVVMILSVMLHEIGHAVAAFWAGDPTARDQGRFSLNPLRHVSWLGSVFVPLILAMLPGGNVIGWAKPVPISPERFRRKRWGSLAVNLAGVSLNLLLAFLAADLLIFLLILFSWLYPQAFVMRLMAPFASPFFVGAVSHAAIWSVAFSFCKTAILLNAFLAMFNLLPVPPLDGFGVIRALLPPKLSEATGKLGGVGMIVLFFLIAVNKLTCLLMPGALLGVILLEVARALGRMPR